MTFLTIKAHNTDYINALSGLESMIFCNLLYLLEELVKTAYSSPKSKLTEESS